MMGVSVEVGTARIGGFGPSLCTRGSSHVERPGLMEMLRDAIRGNCAKMIGLVVAYFLAVLLLLAGDVEVNPGPGLFTCDICQQTFPRRDTLQTHRARHDDQTNCPMCHQPFSTLNVLERHILIQHGSGKRPAANHDNRPSNHEPQPSTSAHDYHPHRPVTFQEPQPSTSKEPQPSTSRGPQPPASIHLTATKTNNDFSQGSDPKFQSRVDTMELDHSLKKDIWWRDGFHEEVPTLAIPHVTYTVNKISQTHHEKYNATKTSYQINFNDIDVEDAGEIMEQLGQVLDNVIHDVAADAAPQDLVQLVVQDDDLDYPIVLPMQRRDELTLENLLRHIEKVLQSHNEINLDSALSINLTHIAMPSGSRRLKNHTDVKTFVEKKKSILQIKNKDDLCCARAIVTGIAKVDRHPKWNSIRQGYQPQQELAQQLHTDANVPLGPCGLDEIKQFQTALPDYQLNLVSALHFNTVIFSGPLKEKKIFIYHKDNHYDVITSITGFLSKDYYCDICKKGYSDKTRHKCNEPCKCCFKLHDTPAIINWIHCDDCDRNFMGQVCFDTHKRPTTQNRTTCGTYKRCGTCKKVVNRHLEDHNCGKVFCTRCKTHENPGHKCYIRSVDVGPKFDLKGNRIKDITQYVFYDYECVQDSGVHIPNLCVAHVVCTKCLDKDVQWCSYCGEREKVFSGPTTNKDFCRWLFYERIEKRKQQKKKQEKKKKNKQSKKYEPKERTIALCHNFKGYDGCFVLQYLYDNSIKPEVIYTGAKIMCVELKDFDIKLIDSYNFLPMALSKLPAMFGLTELAKGYFPHLHNTFANTNTVLPHLPDINLYTPDSKNTKERSKFMQWYEDHKNDEFDTKKELLKYCKSDVDILRRCCLKFRALFMQTTAPDPDVPEDGIDPFITCITIASACNLVFRALHLREDTIGLIPTNGYHSFDNQSTIALKWLKFIAHKRDIRIQHVQNGGEFKIGNYKVDGYHADSKTVFEYDGCYWHGCTTCQPRDKINTVTQKTMEEMYTDTMNKRTYIESLGYNYVQKWGCEFEQDLKTDADLKGYVDNLTIQENLQQQSKQNKSASALRWINYISHEQNISIQHARNGKGVKVGNCTVDGYNAETKTVYQFEACYSRGCLTCYDRNTVNKTTQTTMKELHAATMDKKAHIESLGYSYVQKWNCQYNKDLKSNPAMNTYINELNIVDPLEPRESFFGGRTEGFKLYRETEPDEKIKYVDFTSLYPYVNKYGKYPIGHPKLITENFKALCNYNGIIKCKILPPRSLYLPVLPAKINDKLLFALCRTCAETRQQEKCEHTDQQRAFVGTWVIDEVTKALEKGYEIVETYEIWHYERMSQYGNDDMEDGLFTSYINTFLQIKQEASGWPASCQSEEQKDQYIAEYLAKEGILLRKDKIIKNPGLRALAKLMLNSFWGKFGQRANLSQTTIVDTTAEYYDILTSSEKEIQYVHFINSEIVSITWVYKSEFVDMSDKTNVVIAAFTTAQARLKLYNLLDSLGNRILYADTDSVIYTVKEGEYDPPLGDYLGELTDELDGDFITHFATAGPKNYSYKTSKPDSDGNTSHCKVRGITLNYKNSLAINHEIITKMVKGVGPAKITVTDDHTIVRDKNMPSILTKSTKKDYRVVFDKRVIVDAYDTLPYGY